MRIVKKPLNRKSIIHSIIIIKWGDTKRCKRLQVATWRCVFSLLSTSTRKHKSWLWPLFAVTSAQRNWKSICRGWSEKTMPISLRIRLRQKGSSRRKKKKFQKATKHHQKVTMEMGNSMTDIGHPYRSSVLSQRSGRTLNCLPQTRKTRHPWHQAQTFLNPMTLMLIANCRHYQKKGDQDFSKIWKILLKKAIAKMS
jgi:hypothetical protein